MPDVSTFALFVAAALVMLIVPGPSVLYIVARSVEGGTAGRPDLGSGCADGRPGTHRLRRARSLGDPRFFGRGLLGRQVGWARPTSSGSACRRIFGPGDEEEGP